MIWSGALTRRAVLLGASLPLAFTARTQDHPPTFLTRAINITYIVPPPAGAARQRLRFSVALRALRIDPPGVGLYTVIDFAARRMFTIREADRSAIDMAAPKTWMLGQGSGLSGGIMAAAMSSGTLSPFPESPVQNGKPPIAGAATCAFVSIRTASCIASARRPQRANW
ncbi:MAG: hypothetical protein EXR05_09970 [Acetobacteraceae bacterium]|nr:hypothetical protein [Acetobacteraceae bacterium]MSP29656.1 hypothetical protein [Acetobacteraceae bacterium]